MWHAVTCSVLVHLCFGCSGTSSIMMYHFGSSWLSCFYALFVLCLVMRFSRRRLINYMCFQDFFLSFCVFMSQLFSTLSFHCSTGRARACMLRPAAVGQIHFHFVFADQPVYAAEVRTVIFEFLYVPLPDCWPWERPILTTLNWDLYHFSITCCAFHRPCVTFLTVDTPSIALSPTSDSS